MLIVVMVVLKMQTHRCSCHCGCHGNKYPTLKEQKKHLNHRKECLEKELADIVEALEALEAG